MSGIGGLAGARIIIKAARGLGGVARFAAVIPALFAMSCGVDQQIVNALDPQKDPINPVAVISAPSTATARSYVTLDGTQSYSHRNAALKYNWTLTEKPRCSSAGFGTTASAVGTNTSCVADTTITSNNPSVNFFADKGGYYTVTLSVEETVTTGSGSSATTSTSTSQLVSARINVIGNGSNHPPVAVAKASVAAQDVATLDATESYDIDGQPLTYTWKVMSPVAVPSEVELRSSTSATAYLVNWQQPSQTILMMLHVSDGMDYDEAQIQVTWQ